MKALENRLGSRIIIARGLQNLVTCSSKPCGLLW